jgi:hypothetical protein
LEFKVGSGVLARLQPAKPAAMMAIQVKVLKFIDQPRFYAPRQRHIQFLITIILLAVTTKGRFLLESPEE